MVRFVRSCRELYGLDWGEATPEHAKLYLNDRSKELKQKSLDAARQSLQRVFGQRIPYVRSELLTALRPRAYQSEHIAALVACATPELALSIRISADAGLRAQELCSLAMADELAESDRDWTPQRFVGRANSIEKFVVHGKGGLRRTVAVSKVIAEELKQRRLQQPRKVVDREIFIQQRFDLLAGQNLSREFSEHSKKGVRKWGQTPFYMMTMSETARQC